MSVPLVVRIPKEQKMLLEILASNKNVSVAKITRKAIEDYVAKMDKKEDNFLLRLAKIGESKKVPNAPKDLSENYKSYLYGKD